MFFHTLLCKQFFEKQNNDKNNWINLGLMPYNKVILTNEVIRKVFREQSSKEWLASTLWFPPTISLTILRSQERRKTSPNKEVLDY